MISDNGIEPIFIMILFGILGLLILAGIGIAAIFYMIYQLEKNKNKKTQKENLRI